MQINRAPDTFQPITIILETREEAEIITQLMGDLASQHANCKSIDVTNKIFYILTDKFQINHRGGWWDSVTKYGIK